MSTIKSEAVTGEGNVPRYFYNRAGEVIDSITGKVIGRHDNWYDASGACDSMNDAKDLTFPLSLDKQPHNQSLIP